MKTKSKVKNQKPKAKSKKYIFAIGRRKTATARIRLYHGKSLPAGRQGETLVNSLPIAKYFPGQIAKSIYEKPLVVTNTLGKYYATIKVEGSGRNSQLGAVAHGLSRALDKENKELYHSLLKKEGLLTRDYRAKERRKPGQMGKARKQKQSPKR